MSDSFEIPAALKYSPIEVFKNFGFDKHAVWWGDRDSSDSMEVGADSLYRLSIEVPEYVKAISTRIQSLSMPTVFHEKEPYDVLGRIQHDEYEPPHIHLTYQNETYQVSLEDGHIMEPPNVSAKLRKLLGPYAIKYRKEAVKYWNLWNPKHPADPETGKFINRK
jgi:hypothetical protein